MLLLDQPELLKATFTARSLSSPEKIPDLVPFLCLGSFLLAAPGSLSRFFRSFATAGFFAHHPFVLAHLARTSPALTHGTGTSFAFALFAGTAFARHRTIGARRFSAHL